MPTHDLIESARPNYSENDILELEHAIEFATKAHEGQKRRSGEPYITHPLSVAAILIEWGMDIDSILAGVLHDTIEDTDTTAEQIESLFGRNVAFLVEGVTKVSQTRAGMKSLEHYLPQTTDNLSKLLIAVGHDVRVIIIKLADRLHNLRTLSHMPLDKQKKIARESLDVFAPMADRLGMGRVRMEIEELSFAYLEPVEYRRVQNLMKKRLGRSTRKLGKVRQEVENELKKQQLAFEIDGRVKSIFSLHRKLAKVGGDIDNIYDLMALRIIVPRQEDCYRVLGILHSLYQPMISRIKDYIAVPKPNGYQSLHTVVLTPNEQIVEFQIRTVAMHEYAERGLAASFHYQEQKNSKSYLKRRGGLSKLPAQLQWIIQLQDVASRLQSGTAISHDQLAVDLFSNRIFVYSPKGDIFNLPEGALPLDFAYLVHSDVARNAYAFRINGRIAPFDQVLQNGDRIEILTKRGAGPKEGWMDVVTTSHARIKLRSQLKSEGLISRLSSAAAIIHRKRKSFRKK